MRVWIDLEALSAAVAALAPAPRPRPWVSLSLCVTDAVWNLGQPRHRSMSCPVTRLARLYRLAHPTIAVEATPPPDPIPLSALLSRFPTPDALRAVTTSNRTSVHGGIYKADAALRYAKILHHHGIDTLTAARALLRDPDRLAPVETALAGVPDDGAHGARRACLFRAVAPAERIEPDHATLRWLARHDAPADPATATALISGITDHLNSRARDNDDPRRYTAWEIDHAIWLAGQHL